MDVNPIVQSRPAGSDDMDVNFDVVCRNYVSTVPAPISVYAAVDDDEKIVSLTSLVLQSQWFLHLALLVNF